MKKIICVLALVAVANAQQIFNWNGINDTAIISDLVADSTRYTKAFQLDRWEDPAVLVKIDDTSSAGYSGDSVLVKYGYQLGYPTRDSAGSRDTLWWYRVVLDSLDASAYGTLTDAVADSSGTLVINKTLSDTSDIAGYACQLIEYTPRRPAPLVRYWLEGLTGTSHDSLVVEVQHIQRLYQSSGTK
jgi:hypothetical protein